MRWLLWSLSGLTACGASIESSTVGQTGQPGVVATTATSFLQPTSVPSGSAAPLPALAPPTSLADLAVAPTGAPAEEALAGFATVWGDADWFVEPKTEARSFKLATFKKGSRQTQLDATVPVRILKVHGDFLEVSGSPYADALNLDFGCSLLTLGVDRFTNDEANVDLRLFVRRKDLAPVVTKRFERTFEDGSSLLLLPGANLLKAAEGVLVRVGGGLALVPGELSVGHSFASFPARVPEVSPSESKFILSGVEDVRLAGRPIDLSGVPFANTLSRVEARGDRTLGSLDGRCTSATVSAPNNAVTPPKPGVGNLFGNGLSMGGLGMTNEPHWVLPRGSKLTCDLGKSALTLKTSHRVEENAEPCMKVTIAIDSPFLVGPLFEPSAQTMRCCAPRSALVKVTPPPVTPGIGLGGLTGGHLSGKKQKPQEPKPPKPRPDPFKSRE